MISADTRAAVDFAIAEALRRERMAPDDYKPMPAHQSPSGPSPARTPRRPGNAGTYTHTPGA